MFKRKLIISTFILFYLLSTSVFAGDFDWLKSLSLDARVDESGFSSRLALRFHLGDAKIKTVIRDVGGHADAYMVLRFAEISKQPVDTVIKEYRRNKGKGWGNLAKSLGIKPGSPAFHALKRGHDLSGHDDDHHSNSHNKKNKNKDKGNKNHK